MENLERLYSSDREASHETKKSLIGINLNESPVQSPLPEVLDDSPNTQLIKLPQQITFSSLLNGDYDAIEEQMFLELQSTFSKHEESIGQQVHQLGPINSKRVAEESDPSLTLQLPQSLRKKSSKDIVNMTREDISVSHIYQNLNTSLGKQPKRMMIGNERNLKRVIEVGESSSSKHQKKDSPAALFVANDGIKEGNRNNSNSSSKPITPIMNALYDPKFEIMGLPIDPHIRFMKYMQGDCGKLPQQQILVPIISHALDLVIGTEARGIYNAGQAEGMTFWAPNINIFRDPRWGRGQETAGEDPLVNAKYAVSYVRGLQGDSFEGGKLIGDRLKASACCKHFTAYDLDDWKGIDRFAFDAKVTLQDLADTYQPPFHSCVQQGRSSGIMCAYNSVNGVPNCADYDLLTNTARKKWNFNGYITSDCGAVDIVKTRHGYAKTPEDAIADVLQAGMDVECGDYFTNHSKSAVLQKKVPISHIDRALRNLFSIRIRLGLFDGNPTKLKYGSIGPNQVCSKQNLNLALEAARSGIVLLKNNAKTLPLPKSTNSIAIIGPNANSSSQVVLGNYFGRPCNLVTIKKGFESYAKNIVYHYGCSDGTKCLNAEIEQAVEVAKKVDYVVLVMGLDQSQERESHDRDDLELPGKQQELIERVAKASKRPVILVLLCGGPVDISFAKSDDKIGGILWAGYPGELGGLALAQIVFGDYNPGGRLPVTWYTKDYIKIPMTDMRMRADPSSGYPGRTYRFYTGPTVYEFGYGLSYSKYSYNFISVKNNNLHINQSSTHSILKNSETIRYKLVSEIGEETCKAMPVSVTLGVTNNGNMVGKHPVLLFVKHKKGRNGNPVKQLVGFESVKVEAGQRGKVGFEVNVCDLVSRANENGIKVIEEGDYLLSVGEEEYSINVTL